MSASERKIASYKKLIRNQQRLLAKTRKAIEMIVDDITLNLQNAQKNGQFSPPSIVENEQKSPQESPLAKDNQLNNNKFVQSSESTEKTPSTSTTAEILNKLSKTLLKIIPLELEISRMNMSKATLEELEEMEEKTKMSQCDIEILDDFVRQYNRNNGIIVNPETQKTLKEMYPEI